MNKNRLSRFCLAATLILIPLIAQAWWNNDWPSRKQITVDAGATGADIQETLTDVPVLVRLHTGNFGYFMDLAENGKDLRALLDDTTALKHHVDKFDALSELGLVWVKLATVRGGVSTDPFYLYYGNANAPDGSDAKSIYDVHQSLVFHFKEGETLPQDATAYAVNAEASKAAIDPAGYIGAAAKFDGQGGISLTANPAFEVNPDNGWTFSSWIKVEQNQSNATLIQAQDGQNQIRLSVDGNTLNASFQTTGGTLIQTTPVNLQLGQWQQIALTLQKNTLTVYVNGQSVAQANIQLAALKPSLTFGNGLVGWLDEIQVAKQARSADWLKFQFRSQSPDFAVLNFGQDESNASSSDGNYFVIILQSLTVDGWVVIALCGVMFIISLLVMIGKGMTLRAARRDNDAFLVQYRNVSPANLAELDQDESVEEAEIAESEFLAAIVGKHDHFQGSPIYHIYHAGVQELKKQFNGFEGTADLSAEAINVVRTRLDAAMVREMQKLNKNMVLLTIAISGGPFLGLLGTVLGVMITFAVIAATGDVNINSIAPGISGALLATVAGLAVAIPALFAYNYLLTQIKDVSADMQVFADEFLAVVSLRLATLKRGVNA